MEPRWNDAESERVLWLRTISQYVVGADAGERGKKDCACVNCQGRGNLRVVSVARIFAREGEVVRTRAGMSGFWTKQVILRNTCLIPNPDIPTRTRLFSASLLHPTIVAH